MKKKMIMLGSAVVVSGALMVGSAFSAMASNTSGYEALKSAMKQSNQFDSVTTDTQVTLSDNGENILQIDSLIRGNLKQNSMNSVITVEHQGQTKEIQVFHQGDQNVIKTDESDTYYVIEGEKAREKGMRHHNRHEHAFNGDAEKLLDALVGHYKSHFQLEEAGDNQRVTLQLKGKDIPAAVNVLSSILIKSATNHPNIEEGQPHQLPFFNDSFELNLPKLTEDVRLEGIHLQANITKDQLIEGFTLEIQASGQDQAGKVHALALQLDINYADINRTEVNPIELEGKTIETIDPEQMLDEHNK